MIDRGELLKVYKKAHEKELGWYDDDDLSIRLVDTMIAFLTEGAGAKSASSNGLTSGVGGGKCGPQNVGGAYFDYDEKDDTMHIHFGKPQKCKTIETGENIFIRRTPSGQLSAIEIWNYKDQVG